MVVSRPPLSVHIIYKGRKLEYFPGHMCPSRAYAPSYLIYMEPLMPNDSIHLWTHQSTFFLLTNFKIFFQDFLYTIYETKITFVSPTSCNFNNLVWICVCFIEKKGFLASKSNRIWWWMLILIISEVSRK